VAAHALATMINHMGNYPNPSGTTCLSTLLSEEVFLLIYLFIDYFYYFYYQLSSRVIIFL
jgi:hypothetical protein